MCADKACVVIPVYHPDSKFIELLDSLRKQNISDRISILIIDSGSDGAYRQQLTGLNAVVQEIDSSEFNHGGTRQQAMDACKTELCVYLTQDAILADNKAIENILQVFSDEQVGCAYGRQLPHRGAGPFARFARSFNYGTDSYKRELKDKERYGIKTAFLSDYFSAYRCSAVRAVGGFPKNVIHGEDMYLAARMLLQGWAVAYCAEAKAYHSHDYTIWQEFCRCFDTGVFQSRENWLGSSFGKAEGEGIRFVKEEIAYLAHENPWLLLSLFIRDGMKFLGYKLGKQERYLPLWLKRHISANSAYWG